MEKKLANRLILARKQFNALPDKDEHDYFSVSVYFVQYEPEKIHLVMEAAAVKNSTQVTTFEDSDITFLGKNTILGELSEDQEKILTFFQNASRKYRNRVRVFLPKRLCTFHGLDGKKQLTVDDLIRVIRYSISQKHFVLWNDEVGFRIDCNR